MIEIPERYIRPTDEERELDRVEEKLSFLTDEITQTKEQLNKEQNRTQARILKQHLLRLETDLKLVQREKNYLINKVYGGADNV